MNHYNNSLKILVMFLCFGFSLVSLRVEASAQLRWQKILHKEPKFWQVKEAFFRAEGLQNRDLVSWKKRSKKAAWFPTLYAGYDYSLDEGQSLGSSDNISISSGDITIGPVESDYDFDEDVGHTVRIRAVWKLDEIIFSRRELSVSQEIRNLSRARSELSRRLYDIFEKRHLFLLTYLKTKNHSRSKSQAAYAKFLLLTQHIDALTRQEFSRDWWREKKRR